MPFASNGVEVAVLDRALGRAVGLLSDEDPVFGRCGLEASGRIDDVAGRHSLTLVGAGAERNERLARIDGDPNAQVELRVGLVQLRDRVADRQGRANGTLRVVLVRDRGAEQRDDGVADELLHGAAEALELRAYAPVVGGEQLADVLGIEPLGAARRADKIRESTVTTFRSFLAGDGASASGVAQPAQNRASSGFSRPQPGHVSTLEFMPV